MAASIQNVISKNTQLIVWVSKEEQENIIKESIARYEASCAIGNLLSRTAAVVNNNTGVTQLPQGQSFAPQANKASLLCENL
jgi:hypothetical protein